MTTSATQTRGQSGGRGDVFAVSRASLSIGTLDMLSGRELHHHFAPHMHDAYAIGLIDAGQSHVRYRGVVSTSTPRSLVTISVGEIHTGGPVGDGGWSYRMIYPQQGLLRHAVGSEEELSPLLFRAPFVDDCDARELFNRAYQALEQPGCSLAAEESVLSLLRTLVRRHTSEPPAPSHVNVGSRIARTARDYIEANFTRDVRLATIAGVCGVSPFHLIRIFRREFGVPPHGYLKQLRVGRARAMLCAGLPVSQIAFACGFSDQSHLTRSFKSMVGVPPATYQRGIGRTRC